MTAECPFGGAESSPLTPVWVQVGWNMSLPASTGASARVAGGRKVVSAVMAAVCFSGMLKVAHRHGKPCGADASDVVSVNQIGKREGPTTNACDAHT